MQKGKLHIKKLTVLDDKLTKSLGHFEENSPNLT
jgi:hypothetical protein